MGATPQLSSFSRQVKLQQSTVMVITSSIKPQHDANQRSLRYAEALAADLRAYQRQLLAAAQEMLVGCDDNTWMVAAPTSCSILRTLGESVTSTAC